tara:strand:+ start:5211 stop:6260 length:1050 start_codon:yes stop_codon:yes gene_type:complete
MKNNLNSPYVKGKSVSNQYALSLFKKLLKKSNGVHIDGLGCDLSAMNQIFMFAEKNLSSIDHYKNEYLYKFNSCLQTSRINFASKGEIKKRADLVIVIDENENNKFLDFILSGKTLNKKKKICFVTNKKVPHSLYNYITLNNKSYTDFFDLIYMNVLKSGLTNIKTGSKKYNELLKKIINCKYGTIIFNSEKKSMYFIQRIIDFVNLLNKEKKKFTLFHLNHDDNLAGAIQTSLWKTGFPLRVNFTEKGPIHNSFEYNSIYLKKTKDLQIFISCFNKNPKMNFFKKNIFIGAPDFKLKNKVDIFIPTKIPGLNEDGLVVRSDNVCIEKLIAKKKSSLMSVNEIFSLLNA